MVCLMNSLHVVWVYNTLYVGVDGLMCASGSEVLASTGRGKAVASACPVCCETTKDLHSHMGVHILRAVRNVSDTVINPVDGLLPCGFCG